MKENTNSNPLNSIYIKITAVVAWLILASIFFWYKTTNDLSYLELLSQGAEYFADSVSGVILFLLAYAIRPFILFPASILSVLAGVLYGPVLGIVYTVLGSNASASIAYGIGRFFGGESHPEETKTIGPWIEKAQKETFITVMIMRLIYLPYDLVNYLSGIAKIKWVPFAVATILATLPGTVTFVLLGSSLSLSDLMEAESLSDIASGINPWTLAASFALFIVSFGFAKWYKSRNEHQGA